MIQDVTSFMQRLNFKIKQKLGNIVILYLEDQKVSLRCLYKTHNTVVPRLVRAVTQIKVAIMSYYPQYFAVNVHNTEQQCGFGSALPPEEWLITSRR